MKNILTLLFALLIFTKANAQTLQTKLVADLRSSNKNFAFSSDNQFFVAGGYTLRIYKIINDKPVIYKTISDQNSFINDISFSNDGKYLVANSDKTYIYSVSNDFQVLKTFSNYDKYGCISQFSKSSEYFLIQETDSLFNVYEVNNDEFILKSSTNEYFYGISPNDNYLYSIKRDSFKDAVILFTFNNGEINYLKKIKTINSNDIINIQSIGFSLNEQFLTIDYSTNNKDLDNLKSYKDIYSFNNFNFTYVQTIFFGNHYASKNVFLEDNKTLLIKSDSLLFYKFNNQSFDLIDRKQIFVDGTELKSINTTNNNYLILDKDIYLQENNSIKLLKKDIINSYYRFQFSKNGDYLAVSKDNFFDFYKITDTIFNKTATIGYGQSGVSQLTYSSDGRFLAADNIIYSINNNDYKPVLTDNSYKYFTKDSKYLIAEHEDTVWVYNLKNNFDLIFKKTYTSLYNYGLSKNNNYFYVLCGQKIYIYDIDNNFEYMLNDTLPNSKSYNIDFSNDDEFLIVSYYLNYKNITQVFELQNNRYIKSVMLKNLNGTPHFSSTGKHIYVREITSFEPPIKIIFHLYNFNSGDLQQINTFSYQNNNYWDDRAEFLDNDEFMSLYIASKKLFIFNNNLILIDTINEKNITHIKFPNDSTIKRISSCIIVFKLYDVKLKKILQANPSLDNNTFGEKAISDDLKYLAQTLEHDGTLDIYSFKDTSLTKKNTIKNLSYGIRGSAVAFKPHTHQLAVGDDGGVRIYDLTEILQPAILSITDIDINTTNGNRILEGLETGSISFKIKNQGTGKANNLTATVNIIDVSGLQYSNNINIGNIDINQQTNIEIPISGSLDLTTSIANVNITFTEDNGFEPPPINMNFTTKEFPKPYIELINNSLSPSIAYLGDPTSLYLTIKNTGIGDAENAKISVIFPTGVSPNSDTVFVLQNLKKGTEIEKSFSFFVPFNSPINSFDVKIILKEKYGLYGSTKVITIPLQKKGQDIIDYSAPLLTIQSPVLNGDKFPDQTEPTITIKGKLTDVSDIEFLKINNNEVDLNNNEFIYTINLQPGNNPILIYTSDIYDNELQETFYVKYYGSDLADEVDNISVLNTLKSDRYALIIANENYNNFNHVDYALNDGYVFKQYAENVLGIPSANIQFATNSKTNQMLSILTDVSNRMSPDKELFVFYAGHGYPIVNGADTSTYLLPVDISKNVIAAQGVNQKYFYELLVKNNPKKVTVFIDACFSGGNVQDSASIARGQSAPVIVNLTSPNLNGKIVVFTASSGSEISQSSNKLKHGIFTYYFLLKLKQTNGKISYEEMYNYLKTIVPLKAKDFSLQNQNPKVLFGDGAKDWKNWSFFDE